MRNIKKRILSLFLTVVLMLSLVTLSSCNRRFDDEEVEAAARELLKKAEILNQIYYGSGIRYNEEDGNGYYYRADADHLSELGFSTVSELRALTEKTFSTEYCTNLYTTLLSSLKEDGKVISVARYYQHTDEESGESYIMVYSKFERMLKDSIVYDYNSVKAQKSKKKTVFVSVNATVTNSEGKSQTITLTVNLIEQEDGWKICNPTYANYNELKDRYDELKDQKFN